MIESTERGLVHEDVFKNRFMFEGHYEDLTDVVGAATDDGSQTNLFASAKSIYGNSVLPLWLGLEDMIYSEEERPENNPQEQAANAAGQEQGPEDVDQDEEIENAARAEEGERILEDGLDDEAALRRLEEQRRRRQNAQRAEEQLAVNFDIALEAAADVDARGTWRTQRVDRKRKRQLLRQGLQSNDLMTIDQVCLLQHPHYYYYYYYYNHHHHHHHICFFLLKIHQNTPIILTSLTFRSILSQSFQGLGRTLIETET